MWLGAATCPLLDNQSGLKEVLCFKESTMFKGSTTGFCCLDFLCQFPKSVGKRQHQKNVVLTQHEQLDFRNAGMNIQVFILEQLLHDTVFQF